VWERLRHLRLSLVKKKVREGTGSPVKNGGAQKKENEFNVGGLVPWRQGEKQRLAGGGNGLRTYCHPSEGSVEQPGSGGGKPNLPHQAFE